MSRRRRKKKKGAGTIFFLMLLIAAGSVVLFGLTNEAFADKLKSVTTDRVKEGVFNIIQFDIEGRRVLDLFAGTGQLGIEALSRGAASAVFVEQRRDAAALVRENLKLTGLAGRARVVNGEALAFLASAGERFDLIFLDPPYAAGLWESAMAAISRFDILANHGIIVCESPTDQTMPAAAPPLLLHRTYRYGRVKITTYHREEDEA